MGDVRWGCPIHSWRATVCVLGIQPQAAPNGNGAGDQRHWKGLAKPPVHFCWLLILASYRERVLRWAASNGIARLGSLLTLETARVGASLQIVHNEQLQAITSFPESDKISKS
mgnify:CR=1 FL=1